MSVEHIGYGLGPFFIVPIIFSIVVPLAVLVGAIYLFVCVHQIKNATLETSRELREIRKYLQNHKNTEQDTEQNREQ